MGHLPILFDAADLRGQFSAPTLSRAQAYVDLVGPIDVVEADAEYLEASALVPGSQGHPYIVLLAAQPHRGRRSVSTSCSCPVAHQCKHGAALALALLEAAEPDPTPEQAEDAAPPDAFAVLMNELASLAPPDFEPAGLALQVGYAPHSVSRYGRVDRHGRYHPPEDRPGSERLYLRPLRAGTKQRWVKGGAAWSDLPRLGAGGGVDRDQLRALERLHAAQLGHLPTYLSGPGHEPELAAFGPEAVRLLRAAVDAGVTLVPVAPLVDLEVLAEPAVLAVDVTAAPDGGSLLRVALEVAGELVSGPGLGFHGDPAHSVSLSGDAGRLRLARLEPPLAAGPRRALLREDPVVVPGAEADALPERLRRFSRSLRIGSSDASMAPPEAVPPRLRVTVRWHDASSAHVRWEWVYGADAFALDASAPAHVLRDHAAERAVLGRLDPPPEQPEADIGGADTLHLALLELPVWRAVDDVDVVEVDPPDFRESEEAPEISFEVQEPDASLPAGSVQDGNDWLDLDVLITVEGERVLLAQVIEALTLGQEHIVLPSGLFVRTDRPEFAALDDVVRAAALLRDRRAAADGPQTGDGRLRLSREDLGSLAQLADLGDLSAVDSRAAAWVERARALRDLTDLPAADPVGVASTLRPYQLEGFRWLSLLHEHGLGGILADDMGLGKTLQVLALVARAKALDPGGPPFLVVAPTSVVGNWALEAARHTPGLRVVAVTGTLGRREQTVTALASEADIVVTSYTLLRLDDAGLGEYAAITWGGLVLDEAQQVKNHRSKVHVAVSRLKADFRLAVTGTPFENRLSELWSLLAIVAPGLYPRADRFAEHVARPVERQGDTEALRRFTRRIGPFVLRRTKELVAADLPPKQEQVLDVELAPAHRRLYDTHLAKERQRILGLVDDDFDANRVAILAAITKLRQLALDPALLGEEHARLGSAKIDTLSEHLSEILAEGHRALVFSSFTGFLSRVRERLQGDGVDVAYLDGSTRDRPAQIESFRSGEVPVFLISLKAGGVGLTLTEADYVFMLDPWWNPAAEAQAVDRAHRIGQQRTVMVYRLVSTDTIEQKVMALKARKAALFAQVVDGGAGLAGGITADDIRGLFD